MKRFLAAIAALSLTASIAGAASYHIKPVGGNDANAGTSAAAAWRTVAKANANALPGDVVYLWPGSYDVFPNADSAGSNPTGGGYVRWVGAHSTLDPTADTLAANLIRLPKKSDSVDLKGYQSYNGLWFQDFEFSEGAYGDSLKNSLVTHELRFQGANYCVVDRIYSTAQRLFIGTSQGTYDDMIANGNEVHSSVFRGLGVGCYDGEQVVHIDHQDSLLIEFNKFFIRMEPTAVDIHPRMMFHITNNIWRYNRFDVQNDATQTGAFTLGIRDSCNTNLFNADTLYSQGSGAGAQLGFSMSGAHPGTVYGTTIDSCTFIIKNGMGAWFQNWMDRCTITRNSFVTQEEALIAGGVLGANTIDHNNFVSATTGRWTFGIVALDGYSYGDTNTFTNNIIASLAPPVQYVNFYNEMPNSSRLGGLMVGSNIDKNFIKARNNLYSVWEWRYSNGDRSNVWWTSEGGVNNGKPGGITSTNPTAYTSAYDTTTRLYGDSLSYWGSPQFQDSSLTFEFNPTLLVGTAAEGRGTSGSDIGAKAYSASPRMVVNPASLSFHGADIGTPDTLYITVFNIGGADLEISGAAVDDNDLQIIYGDDTVVAGASTTYGVIFTPTSSSSRTASMSFTTNDPSQRSRAQVIPIDLNIRATGGDTGEGLVLPR